MSDSKVSPTLTESTEKAQSILNNNYIKIGGAIVVFFIFVIILYFSFRSVPSSKRRVDRFVCILYPKCNYVDTLISKEELIKEYPDIDTVHNHGPIVIANEDRQEMHNVLILSIRSQGYIITGYSEPGYFGEKYLMQDDRKTGRLEIKCTKPIRSFKIEKDTDAFTN